MHISCLRSFNSDLEWNVKFGKSKEKQCIPSVFIYYKWNDVSLMTLKRWISLLLFRFKNNCLIYLGCKKCMQLIWRTISHKKYRKKMSPVVSLHKILSKSDLVLIWLIIIKMYILFPSLILWYYMFYCRLMAVLEMMAEESLLTEFKKSLLVIVEVQEYIKMMLEKLTGRSCRLYWLHDIFYEFQMFIQTFISE